MDNFLQSAVVEPVESQEDIDRILDDVVIGDIKVEESSQQLSQRTDDSAFHGSQQSYDSIHHSSQLSYDSTYHSSQSSHPDSYMEDTDFCSSQPTSSQGSGGIELKTKIKEEPVDFEECDVKYEFLDFDPTNESSDSDKSDLDVEDAAPVYPSEENVQQNDFFGAFGLIKKSDMPKPDLNESKLHRNRGGKLRRLVKPKIRDDMLLYGKHNTYIDSDSNSILPSAPGSREASPRKSVTKSKSIQYSPKNRSRVLQDSEEESDNETKLKETELQGKEVCKVRMQAKLAPALHPQLMTSVASSPMRVLTKVSELEEREKKGLSIDDIKEEIFEVKEELPSRRSSRLKEKQKNWTHLLRHNPDAYEKPSNLEKQQVMDVQKKRNIKPRLPYYAQPYVERGRRTLWHRSEEDDDATYVRLYEEAIRDKAFLPKRPYRDWVTANRQLEEEAKQRSMRNQEALKTISKDLPGHYPALHGVASTVQTNRGKTKGHPRGSQWNRHKGTGKSEKISGGDISLEDSENGVLLSELCPPPEDIDFNAKKPEPTSFMDILKEREAQKKEEPVPDEYTPVFLGPPVEHRGEGLNETYCLIPHMCKVCWVNDHMYCKNMKRNPKDIKPYGDCLHFRPCEHYALRARDKRELVEEYSALRASTYDIKPQQTNVLKVKHDPKYEDNEVDILGDHDGEEVDTEDAPMSLECDEELSFQEVEEPCVPPGTELLSAQLTAREHYIKLGLGTETLPEFTKIEFPIEEPEQPPQNPSPYIARHGAEIIVASENTWYYPPKHLDNLMPKQRPSVPTPGWVNAMKATEVKTVFKEEAGDERFQKYNYRMVQRISNNPENSQQNENRQKVIKVRVRKIDPRKIVIQQIMGDKNEKVMRETVLKMDEELTKAKVLIDSQQPNNKDDSKLIGDIIAREALKLVQNSSNKPQFVASEVADATSSAQDTDEQDTELRQEIQKITNDVKEKFSSLYKRNGGSSVDAAELSDSTKLYDAWKLLDEIRELKKRTMATLGKNDNSIVVSSDTVQDGESTSKIKIAEEILISSDTSYGKEALNSTSTYTIKNNGKPIMTSVDRQSLEEKKSEGVSADLQTLTFTTKDIRQQTPALMHYIKSVGLGPGLITKLNNEKQSLEKMIETVKGIIQSLEASLKDAKSTHNKKFNARQWTEKQQQLVSQKIMAAVDESVEITRNNKEVDRKGKELVERYNFLQQLKRTIEISEKPKEAENIGNVVSKLPIHMGSVTSLAKELNFTLHPTQDEEGTVKFTHCDENKRMGSSASTKMLEAITSELFSHKTAYGRNSKSTRSSTDTTVAKPLTLHEGPVSKPVVIEPESEEKVAFAKKRQQLNAQKLIEQQIKEALANINVIEDVSQVEMSIEISSSTQNSQTNQTSETKEQQSTYCLNAVPKHFSHTKEQSKDVNTDGLSNRKTMVLTSDTNKSHNIDQSHTLGSKDRADMRASISDAGWVITSIDKTKPKVLSVVQKDSSTTTVKPNVRIVYPPPNVSTGQSKKRVITCWKASESITKRRRSSDGMVEENSGSLSKTSSLPPKSHISVAPVKPIEVQSGTDKTGQKTVKPTVININVSGKNKAIFSSNSKAHSTAASRRPSISQSSYLPTSRETDVKKEDSCPKIAHCNVRLLKLSPVMVQNLCKAKPSTHEENADTAT